jgi:hypothetical protein
LAQAVLGLVARTLVSAASRIVSTLVGGVALKAPGIEMSLDAAEHECPRHTSSEK